MADVVEHVHEGGSGGNNNMGMMIAAVALVIVVILIIFYGLPYLRNVSSGPSVTVPDQIDVNVNEK